MRGYIWDKGLLNIKGQLLGLHDQSNVLATNVSYTDEPSIGHYMHHSVQY